MMLAIAIISTILWSFRMIVNISLHDMDVNETGLMIASIAVISWWNICLPISIILIILAAIFALILILKVSNNGKF